MANTNKILASQQLREVAAQKEAELLGKNVFKETSSEYSATKVPTEIDGALQERVKLTVSNIFTEENGYKNPDGENI